MYKKHIEVGGRNLDPIRDIMTIPEVAQLVMQAGAMVKGGGVYLGCG